jgi:hypothetical protein
MSRRQLRRVGEQAVRSTQPVPPTKTRRTIHPKKLPPKMRPSHPCYFLVKIFGPVFDVHGNFSEELYVVHLNRAAEGEEE